MTTRLAKLRGARRVFLTGSSRATLHSRHRLEVGQQMGADVALSGADDDIAAAVKAAVPSGVDRVLVTAPPRTLPLAFEIARFGAIIGLIGIEFGAGGEVPFDVNAFHFKKLQLRASHAIPNHYFPTATDLLARRVIDPDLLLSHAFALDAYEEAFAVLTDPEQAAVKVVLLP
jgi:L-iditol 2-dehydrogenase